MEPADHLPSPVGVDLGTRGMYSCHPEAGRHQEKARTLIHSPTKQNQRFCPNQQMQDVF